MKERMFEGDAEKTSMRESKRDCKKKRQRQKKMEERNIFNARIFKDECFKDNTDNNPSHTLSQVLAHAHTEKLREDVRSQTHHSLSVVCDQVRN